MDRRPIPCTTNHVAIFKTHKLPPNLRSTPGAGWTEHPVVAWDADRHPLVVGEPSSSKLHRADSVATPDYEYLGVRKGRASGWTGREVQRATDALERIADAIEAISGDEKARKELEEALGHE